MADESVPENGASGLADTSPTTLQSTQAEPTNTSAPTDHSASGTSIPTSAPQVPPAPTPLATVIVGPFELEARVLNEGMPIRDDISATQATPTATLDVSSNHIARLLYQPIEIPGGPVYRSQVLQRRISAQRG